MEDLIEIIYKNPNKLALSASARSLLMKMIAIELKNKNKPISLEYIKSLGDEIANLIQNGTVVEEALNWMHKSIENL